METKTIAVCERKDCRFWNKFNDDNCAILRSAYENDVECPFYKELPPEDPKVIDG